jgi:hypothetical protein
LSAAWIEAFSRSSVKTTIGRGARALTTLTCSSTSRDGDSVSMMMTSGASSVTRSASASPSADTTTTSYPAATRPSLSGLSSSWESSTSMTRNIRGFLGWVTLDSLQGPGQRARATESPLDQSGSARESAA